MKRLGFIILAVLATAALVHGAKPAPEKPIPSTATATSAAVFPAAPAGARITSEGWFTPAQRRFAKPALPAKVSKAVIIPIRETISRKTYDSILRKVRTRAAGAQIIIFDIDTYGGDMGSMFSIMELLTSDLKGVYTIAYVHPKAWSAGAMISLACTEIVMAPNGKIGDAMPVQGGPGGMVHMEKEERGKVESPALAMARDMAANNGYISDLCEGMITMPMELWLIRNVKTSELRIVNAAAWGGKVMDVPPARQSSSAPAPAKAAWEYVRLVDGPETLVSLTDTEALFAGISANTFASMEELCKHYNIVNTPQVLGDNWSEQLVEFLTTPWVVGILLFIGALCFYTEINTPGFGVAGFGAILCFGLYFGSHLLVGMAQWWHIALFVVGLGLILVEIFVYPHMGLLLVAGAIMMLVGLIGALMPSADGWSLPKSDLDWKVFRQAVFAVAIAFICSVPAMVILSRFLPKMPVARRIVLADALHFDEAPVTESSGFSRIRAGDIGVAQTLCRPVGKVRFGDELLDAAIEGDVAEIGQKVRVVRREGNMIYVEKA